MTSPHVVIAGGGIGGLTAAIILAQNGAAVKLVEQADAFTEIGAGLQQSPNAMHVHAAMGTNQAVIAAGFEPEFAALRDYATGRALLTTPLTDMCRARYGQPYIHIHRADLQDILVEAAKDVGVSLHMGHTANSFEQNSLFVTLKTDKDIFSGDVLIGADGIHSTIRAQMHGKTPPRFTGQTAWRGTLPASAVPEDLLPKAANVWMGAGQHFVAYYLRGGDLINFVAVQEREAWVDESWTLKGGKTELRAAFDGWDACVTHLIDAVSNCHLWGLFDRAPLPFWSQGRTTLLGDAAHPMLPFMAQGAAIAMEDAWVIAQQILTATDIVDALTAYEIARSARGTKLQNISRDNAKLFHESGAFACALRGAKLGLASKVPALQHVKLGPIYGMNVTKDYPL